MVGHTHPVTHLLSVVMAASTTFTWDQISSEHCYPKLMAQWSTIGQSLPTCHLFQSTESEPGPADSGIESGEGENDEDMVIDVVGVADSPPCPYNESKVKTVMNECSQNMNLVRISLENADSELERVFSECNYQQQILLTKCLQILREDLLARLVYTEGPNEPIQRRLHCDKTAKKFRKLMSNIKWDPQLTQWCHKALMRSLDDDLLPVYMDILQTLKSKCPALVEQMIHNGPAGGGTNEALNLLLKRPWNPVIGMVPMDKQIRFDPAPIFVTVPHATGVLGSRRWRLWQSQLSAIGKVFPVVTPEHFQEIGQVTTLRESVETILHCTVSRVQELKEQYPTRPIILISWTSGCRIACKIAEVEKVSGLINLGLPILGLGHAWNLSSDPFIHCTTPCIFVIGESGPLSSQQYNEELRVQMKCQTSLVVIHGADDLLRLTAGIKEEVMITQSMLDRLIQDKIYEFLVYVLPCAPPIEIKLPRKRKSGSTDEHSSCYLSNAVPNNPIVLSTQSPNEDKDVLRLSAAVNSSSSVLRSLLGVKTGNRSNVTPSSSNSSLISLPQSNLPPSKLPRIGRPPKLGRPRSKSMTSTESKGKNKSTSRNRSKSGDVSLPPPSSPPIHSPGNSNGNNSNDASPNTLLSLTKDQICPLLPITPPKPSHHPPN